MERATARRATSPATAGRFGLVGLAVAAATFGIACVGAGPSAGASSLAGCGSGTPKLTVDGSGVVTATPDLLTLSLDVSTTGADATAALSANDTATAAIVGALTSGGVKAKDVQTTNLSVQATYGTTGSTVTGYAVDNTVVAKIRALSSAGSLIDAAVGAGGNATRIDSLSFSVTDPRSVQDKARQMAVHQAVSHASSMASAARERLGPICSLKDTSPTTSTVPRPIIYGSTRAGVAQPANATVPVEPGTEKVTADVSAVYALTPGRVQGSSARR